MPSVIDDLPTFTYKDVSNIEEWGILNDIDSIRYRCQVLLAMPVVSTGVMEFWEKRTRENQEGLEKL
jgi:hypothetical protein